MLKDQWKLVVAMSPSFLIYLIPNYSWIFHDQTTLVIKNPVDQRKIKMFFHTPDIQLRKIYPDYAHNLINSEYFVSSGGGFILCILHALVDLYMFVTACDFPHIML